MNLKDFKTCFSGHCGFCDDCYNTIHFQDSKENNKEKNYKHPLNVLYISTGERYIPPPIPENPWEMYQRMKSISEKSFKMKELKKL